MIQNLNGNFFQKYLKKYGYLVFGRGVLYDKYRYEEALRKFQEYNHIRPITGEKSYKTLFHNVNEKKVVFLKALRGKQISVLNFNSWNIY